MVINNKKFYLQVIYATFGETMTDTLPQPGYEGGSSFDFDTNSYLPVFKEDGALEFQKKSLFEEVPTADKVKKIKEDALPEEVASLETALSNSFAQKNVTQLRSFAKALSHYLVTHSSTLSTAPVLQQKVLRAEDIIAQMSKEERPPVEQAMVQSVLDQSMLPTDEPRDLPPPQLPVREGTLVIGRKEPEAARPEAVKPAVSAEEERIDALLDALKNNKRDKAKELILQLKGPEETSQMVKKLYLLN